MNKVFIGLLIIAAGAGVYYFLQREKIETGNTIEKELLTGKWILDSIDCKTKDSSDCFMADIAALDSNFTKYRYDFKAGGNVLKSVDGSLKADSSHYEWKKKNELIWKENASDSTSETFIVTKLTADSLLLFSKDSATYLFTKLK